jgi:Tol biopolymer transport system component
MPVSKSILPVLTVIVVLLPITTLAKSSVHDLLKTRRVSLNTPRNESCIRLSIDAQHDKVIDPRTGASYVENRTASALPSVSPLYFAFPSTSPDGEYIAYQEPAIDGEVTVPSKLLLRPVRQGKAAVLASEILNIGPETLQYAWSPDGRWLAYRWALENGQQFVGITSPDGKQRQIEFIDAKRVSFQGWLADSKYIILVSEVEAGKRLLTFTAPELQLVEATPPSELLTLRPYAMFVEFLAGLRIAYLEFSGEDTRLVVFSPGKFEKQYLAVPGRLGGPQIFRAPDDRAIAVISYMPSGENYRLDIFDLAGKTFSRVSQNVAWNLFLRYAPAVWSSDGRVFFFSEGSLLSALDAMAFHLDDGRPQTIATGLYTGPFYAPDLQHGLVEWFVAERLSNLGLVDVNGQKPMITVVDDIPAPYVEIEPYLFAWSPDSKTIVVMWATVAIIPGNTIPLKLGWIHTDGSTREDLEEDTGVWPRMVWSFDGKWLAYSVLETGTITVKIADSRSTNRRTLLTGLTATPLFSQPVDLLWSPDGRMLAVISGDEVKVLDIVDLNGTGLYHLKSLSGSVAWTPCKEPESAIF